MSEHHRNQVRRLQLLRREVEQSGPRSDDFYDSKSWLKVRYHRLVMSRGCCECCGQGGSPDNPLHVDHIKPRSKYPEIALTVSNLQVLCQDCNIGKGDWDETDWREV